MRGSPLENIAYEFSLTSLASLVHLEFVRLEASDLTVATLLGYYLLDLFKTAYSIFV